MCTNLAVLTGANSQYHVTARTMDFGEDFTTHVCLIPRSQSFPFAKPDIHALSWTNPYGFVGMAMETEILRNDKHYFTDGMNEKGLSAACLWLPGTQYPEPNSRADSPYNIYSADVTGWLLGNFASVADVEAHLTSVNIIDSARLFPTFKAPLHWMVNDAKGDHLVIELINGVLQTYSSSSATPQNVLPVMTNAPPYDWQMSNQTNYVGLTLTNNTQQFWGQEINGSGLLGMPGDATPPSRFVRANMLRQSTFQPSSAQEAVGLAIQVIQNLIVPHGTILTDNGRKDADHTQWTVVRDHGSLIYYFFTAFNNNLFAIDLNKLDFARGQKSQIPAVQPTWVTDVTSSLGAAT